MPLISIPDDILFSSPATYVNSFTLKRTADGTFRLMLGEIVGEKLYPRACVAFNPEGFENLRQVLEYVLAQGLETQGNA